MKAKTKHGVHTMRSVGQLQALERDEYRCQWCLVVLERIRDATDAHHIFRPRSDYDMADYIVSLCHEHHLRDRHISGKLTDKDIIDRVMIPYIWNGEDRTPKGAQFSRYQDNKPREVLIHETEAYE